MKSEKLIDFLALILACVLVWNAVILLTGSEASIEIAASLDLFFGFLTFVWALMGWLDRYDANKRRGFNGPEEPDKPYYRH